MGRVLFVFLLFLVFIPRSLAAEIININYKYKVAFTDMTESEVKPGDLVLVALPDGEMAPLKVLETFPVMAKLTVADGDKAITEQKFASIVVGSVVTPSSQGAHAPRVAVKKPAPAVEPEGVSKAEVPAGIETYSPGAGGRDAVSRPKPVDRGAADAVDVPAPVRYAAEDASADRGRMAAMEQRLDQMMASNIKLTDSITQLLTEKNSAEALARVKEADALTARKKANDLADVNAELNARVQTLTGSVDALAQEKAAQQKEIAALNVRLGELKKKLTKMVDIVNTNMKAYEKQ
ncbi:MAG: hypothetical protein HQL17_04800 [Candidatus Omnitrophica bacterium]|nr:hypothetical protein [Candidatus Omnitrophota bacterium]